MPPQGHACRPTVMGTRGAVTSAAPLASIRPGYESCWPAATRARAAAVGATLNVVEPSCQRRWDWAHAHSRGADRGRATCSTSSGARPLRRIRRHRRGSGSIRGRRRSIVAARFRSRTPWGAADVDASGGPPRSAQRARADEVEHVALPSRGPRDVHEAQSHRRST